MTRSRLTLLCVTTLLSTTTLMPAVYAGPPDAPAGAAKKADTKSQSEVASKSAKIATVAASSSAVKSAMDAKDLAGAKTKVGKSASFVGTVSKVFAPKSNKLVILNFDPKYKTAMTAVVFSTSFGKFPDLAALEGKKLLVTGKITEFHGGYEVILDAPTDLKIVE